MAIQAFYVAVYDDERMVFELLGPMSDDTSLINRVYEAQQRGRNIRCGTTSSAPEQIASATGYVVGKVSL